MPSSSEVLIEFSSDSEAKELAITPVSMLPAPQQGVGNSLAGKTEVGAVKSSRFRR